MPVTADQGYHLRVLVTATNATGSGVSESSATNAVAGPVPAETAAPTVTGTARVGLTLTAHPGTWSPAATSYAYQWQRSTDGGVSWNSITNATASTYVTTSADAGAKVRVVVTAANANGSGTAANSAAFGPLSGTPFATTVPAATGTLAVGHALTATEGSWSPAGISYAYQWQRSLNKGVTWSSIVGATASTYTMVTADGNARIRVLVSATNGSGSATSVSAATAAIAPGIPADTIKPVITGSASRGSTLTAGLGTWNNVPTGVSYQWERSGNGSNWTAISGATARTYTLGSADVGSVIEVLITASNAAGSATVASTTTASVKAMPPVATTAPKLSGSTTVGGKLAATLGGWTGVGNTYAYQWQVSNGSSWANLAGATGSTLTLVSADAGHSIRVLVTATNADGSSSSASGATLAVAAAKAAAVKRS